MVVLGVVGAVVVDWLAPTDRWAALVAAVVALVVAVAVVWVLLPGVTRRLMVSTVRGRLGRG